MKTDFMKRLTSLVAALALILSIAIPSTIMAEGDAEEGAGDSTTTEEGTTSPDKTSKVVLHKLLLTEDQLANWETPEGYDAKQDLAEFKELLGASANIKEIENVYFAFKNSNGEWIDVNGNVVTDVSQALGGLTTTTGIELDTSKLPKGVYQIHEVPELSTYVGENQATLTGSKAVPVEITLPVVNKDGIVETAHVYPKNTENPPTIVKEAKGEGSESTLEKNVGDKIDYVITTNIPKDTKYKTLRWSDEMTKGLTYNRDLVIKTKKGETETNLVLGTDYKFIYETDLGFKLELTEEGLKKVNGQGPIDVILEYSATINTTAVVDQADTNKIVLDYSNKPIEENEPPTITNTTEIPVSKTWAEGEAPAGAKVTVGLFEKTIVEGQERWKLVETKELNSDNSFKEKFTGLNTKTEYKVIELEYEGYTPEYEYEAEGEEPGLKIKNKKKDYPSIEDEGPKVVTRGKKFVKKAGTTVDDESLAGAKFYIRDADNNTANYLVAKTIDQKGADISAYNTAETAYINAITRYNELLKKDELTAEEQAEKTKLDGDETVEGSIANLKKIRDEAYVEAKLKYDWEPATADGKAPANAVVLASDLEGNFEIAGIKAGTYYLEEFEAPAGYAKLTKKVEFKAAEGTYDGPAAQVQIIENKKVDIPQTGGMGTILFTIAGLGIMALAFVMLKKKNNEA